MNILMTIGVVLAGVAVVSLPGLLLAFIVSRIAKKKFSNVATPIMIVSTIILILAAIAIPDFLKFCGKSKQSEAKTNLGAIFTTQVAYFNEHHAYAGGPDAFKVLNWEPVGQNMYAYACGDDYIPNKKGDRATLVVPPWPDGLRPASSKTGFTCFAVGNIDNDTALDYWYINDAKVIVNEPSDL